MASDEREGTSPAFSQQSKLIAWAILFACIVCLPVGLSVKNARSVEPKASSGKKWSSFLHNENRLLVLRLNGMIYDDSDEAVSFFPNVDSPGYVRRQLRKAVDDENIKGILLRINSPGGTVGTSQEIYSAVEDFRKKGKPVVVSMGDLAASGGYYIASASDRIFANPGTLTGSIGVIMHLLNWQETEKKIGIQPIVIKSGLFKDIGSADRPMTAEEKTLLQNIIMDSYDQFVTAVAGGRKLDKDAVKKLADGRVYTGRQALQVKLVDELGGYDQALLGLQKIARQRFKLDKDLPVDDGSPSMNLFANLFQTSSSSRLAARNGILKGLLPDFMDSAYNKQPLWIMQ